LTQFKGKSKHSELPLLKRFYYISIQTSI